MAFRASAKLILEALQFLARCLAASFLCFHPTISSNFSGSGATGTGGGSIVRST